MPDGDHGKEGMSEVVAQQGMSQAVATIYRTLIDELKFVKQQQWMITNYLLLVLAAIFGIAKAITTLTAFEKFLATAIVVVAAGFCFYVLIDLQRYMDNCRKRLEAIEREDSKCFTTEERKFLRLEPYQSTFRRGLPVFVGLMLVSAFGGLFVGYALWR
jgi:hypothetical protein